MKPCCCEKCAKVLPRIFGCLWEMLVYVFDHVSARAVATLTLPRKNPSSSSGIWPISHASSVPTSPKDLIEAFIIWDHYAAGRRYPHFNLFSFIFSLVPSMAHAENTDCLTRFVKLSIGHIVNIGADMAKRQVTQRQCRGPS